MIKIDAKQSISAERFADIISQSVRSGDCLLFAGYDPGTGYGRIEFKEQQIYVHRAAFAVAYRPIADGYCVCHTCDIRNCIEPSHLFEGTDADNIADMHAKNRAVPPPVMFGEDNPQASLTDAQIQDIRSRMASGSMTQRGAARQFCVSQSTIWRIINGKTRTHYA